MQGRESSANTNATYLHMSFWDRKPELTLWLCGEKLRALAIFNSFNFIFSFVLCVQLCVQYSTCIQHSTRYSIFNFPFNIQLFILYSIPYLPIQLSIQQFQPFIQHSTLIFKTFNYSFNIQLFIQLF